MHIVRKMFLLKQALKFGRVRTLKDKDLENDLIILVFLFCGVSALVCFLWNGSGNAQLVIAEGQQQQPSTEYFKLLLRDKEKKKIPNMQMVL